MNLPGTSALDSPHHQISHIPPLPSFPNFTTSNLFYLRTYSLPPLNSVTLTSMLYAFISASILSTYCTSRIPPLSSLPNFTTSNLSHLRTPLFSPIYYSRSSPPPSRYIIVRLAFRSYPLSIISLPPISPLYILFLLIYTSNFPTRTYHLHFAFIPFLSMFSSHSR